MWGEYAVLAGATAGVLAIDRYVTCSLTPGSPTHAPGWQLSTAGYPSKPTTLATDWLQQTQPPPANHPGHLLWHAARQAGLQTLTNNCQLHLDSAEFYLGERKLGFGSSAATCTALYLLCAQLTGQRTSLSQAMAVHQAAQQGAGSGIDVAASYRGGLLHFRRQADSIAVPSAQIEAAQWPTDLYWRAFWTGQPASTPTHLAQFARWRAHSDTHALTELVNASNQCSHQLNVASLHDYVGVLREFDQHSDVGIYTQGHGNLHNLAKQTGVLYKPCGAGGGDIGVAVADDPVQLAQFAAQAQTGDIVEIGLKAAQHGATTRLGNH